MIPYKTDPIRQRMPCQHFDHQYQQNRDQIIIYHVASDRFQIFFCLFASYYTFESSSPISVSIITILLYFCKAERKKDFFLFFPEEILFAHSYIHSLLQASFTSVRTFPLISEKFIEKILHISIVLTFVLLLIF